MNSVTESRTWSVRRWLGVTLMVLAVQLLLVFGLSRRGFADGRTLDHAVPARLSMVMGASDEDRIMAGVGGIDPALFAVAHRAGFSARGSKALSVSGQVLSSLLEPPHWLQGGPALFEAAASTTQPREGGEPLPGFMASDKPSSDFSNLGSGTVAPVPETRIRLGGGLAKRKILRGEFAPLLTAPQVVRSSVVQLGVDGEGFVQSARLVDSSDWAAADKEALRHARKMRFQSELTTNRAGVLDWGTVSFSWQISGVSATNRAF